MLEDVARAKEMVVVSNLRTCKMCMGGCLIGSRQKLLTTCHHVSKASSIGPLLFALHHLCMADRSKAIPGYDPSVGCHFMIC